MPAFLNVLDDASPLSHLKVCPECQASRVSAPVLCKGRQYPDHENWWYETCINNHRPTHTGCKFFSWREDIEKRKPTSTPPCGGTLCQQLHAAKRINIEYDNAVAADNVESTAPGGSADISRTDLAKDASRGAPKAPTSHKQRSYAISISPIYQDRLVAQEQTDRRRIEAAEVEADFEQRQNCLVTIYWWDSNGHPPSVFVIEPPHFPYFHPRDCPQLVTRFQSDSVSFQYFEWKLYTWVQGDSSSPVRNLKTAGELHYRSEGVDQAPGMPPHGIKRRLEDPEEYGRQSSPATPMRHLSPFVSDGAGLWTRSSSVLVTPSSSRRSTPTASLAMITPSSSFGTITPSLGAIPAPSAITASSSLRSTPTTITPSAFGTITQSPGAIPALSSEARLPALFPELADLSSPPSFASSPGPVLSGSTATDVELDLGPAPRGRHRSRWPFLYVCDMAAGFGAMRTLEDAGVQREVAFEEAFQEKYVRSTWSDNSRMWSASARTPELRERYIRAGRMELGLWTAFAREVRQG